MNTLLKFSEVQLREWNEEIKMQYKQMLLADVPLMKHQILTDPEVCAILGVSDRTMRTYRQRQYFHFIKLDGRILYVRWVFLLDLVCHNLQTEKNDENGSQNDVFSKLLLILTMICI